jgi:hypothetical protein
MKMQKASKNYGELAELLRVRNIDADTCCYLIIKLNTEGNYFKMASWIKKNKNAGQTEIMQQMKIILDIVPFYTMPKAAFAK